MINPASVVKIFADRAPNLPSIVSNSATCATTVTHRESEVADLLCSVLESATSSHSHTFEVETTLDHESADNELTDDVECEDTDEEASDPNWNGENEIENEEKALCKRFHSIT